MYKKVILMKVINSLQNEYIKELAKLNDKKVRNSQKQFLIEGYHLVEEAGKTPYLKAVLACKESELEKYEDIVETYLVNEDIIKKLSNTVSPQPIIGVMSMVETSLEAILASAKALVLLDNINDPGNLGSIIRTATALGYDGIIMSNQTVDIYNDKTIRASQGSLFKIGIIQSDLVQTIRELKNQEFKCYGTSLKKAHDVANIIPETKFAICFGNEAHGMTEDVLAEMDGNIKITMHRDMESLNVLAASSIVMYELINKRGNLHD